MPSSVSVGSRPSSADDALVLVGLEAVAFEDSVSRWRVMHESSSRAAARDRAGRPARRPPTRTGRRPSALPSTGSQARSGCGIRPTTLRASLQMPAMLLSEPFGLAASVAVAARRRSSGRRRGRSLRASRSRRARRSSCLRRARSASAAPGRRGARSVNGVSVCSTRTRTCSQWNFRSRLRSIAPGSSPASSRIWKPLQMPSTGPPGRGELGDRRHDRREPGDRAGAQVVAVREAAGQDHDVGAARGSSPCARRTRASWPSTCLRGVVGVVIAVGSGKDDDGEFHRCAPQLPADGSIDFDPIALDHRIGEQLVGDLGGQRLAPGRPTPTAARARSTCPAARRRRRRSPCECSASAMVCPCGSKTDGFSVTKTRAFIDMAHFPTVPAPAAASSAVRPNTRSKIASTLRS